MSHTTSSILGKRTHPLAEYLPHLRVCTLSSHLYSTLESYARKEQISPALLDLLFENSNGEKLEKRLKRYFPHLEDVNEDDLLAEYRKSIENLDKLFRISVKNILSLVPELKNRDCNSTDDIKRIDDWFALAARREKFIIRSFCSDSLIDLFQDLFPSAQLLDEGSITVLSFPSTNELFSDLQKNREVQAIVRKKILAPRVETLSLRRLSLVEFPVSIFGLFPTIKTMNLAKNRLSSIPREIGYFSSLVKLDLSHNSDLKTLPEEIGNLTRLQSLTIDFCPKISKLPQSIEKLSNIEFFYMRNGTLASMEPLTKLSKLKVLKLSNQKIAMIPATIVNLRSLQWLDLERNSIQLFPKELTKIKSLHILKLSHNRIEQLPDSFYNLQKVHTFDLSHNRLSALPPTLSLMTNILVFHVAYNRLKELPSPLYPFLGRLDYLESPTYSIERNRFPSLNKVRKKIRQESKAYGKKRLYKQRPRFRYEHLCVFSKRKNQQPPPLKEGEKEALDAFIDKISESYNFPFQPRTLSNVFLSFVHFAEEHAYFKKIFYEKLEEGSSSCGDRIALYLNKIHLYYLLFHPEERKKLNLVELITGAYRLQLLEGETTVYSLLNDKREIDEIELFLHLEQKFHKELDLPKKLSLKRFGCAKMPSSEECQDILARIKGESSDPKTIFTQSQLWKDYVHATDHEKYEEILNLPLDTIETQLKELYWEKAQPYLPKKAESQD